MLNFAHSIDCKIYYINIELLHYIPVFRYLLVLERNNLLYHSCFVSSSSIILGIISRWRRRYNSLTITIVVALTDNHNKYCYRNYCKETCLWKSKISGDVLCLWKMFTYSEHTIINGITLHTIYCGSAIATYVVPQIFFSFISVHFSE